MKKSLFLLLVLVVAAGCAKPMPHFVDISKQEIAVRGNYEAFITVDDIYVFLGSKRLSKDFEVFVYGDSFDLVTVVQIRGPLAYFGMPRSSCSIVADGECYIIDVEDTIVQGVPFDGALMVQSPAGYSVLEYQLFRIFLLDRVDDVNIIVGYAEEASDSGFSFAQWRQSTSRWTDEQHEYVKGFDRRMLERLKFSFPELDNLPDWMK